MIIDYAPHESKWNRFWKRSRTVRRILGVLYLIGIVVIVVLLMTHEVSLVNFQQRAQRHQRVFLGWVITQWDGGLLGGYATKPGPGGQWELLTDRRMISIDSSGQPSYAAAFTTMLDLLEALEFTGRLPASERQAMIDQMWQAAADHNMKRLHMLRDQAMKRTARPTTQPTP